MVGGGCGNLCQPEKCGVDSIWKSAALYAHCLSVYYYTFSFFWHLDYVNLVLAPWGWLTQDGWCWWPDTAAHMPSACRGEACLLSKGTLSSTTCLIGWRTLCPWFYVMSFPWKEKRWIIKKALQNDKSGAKCSYFAAFWSSAEVLFGIAMARAAARFPPTAKATPLQQSLRQDQHYRFRKLLRKSLIQSFDPQETCIWFSCVPLATALGGWFQADEEPSCCFNRCLDRSKALCTFYK